MPKRIQMSRQHPWRADNPDAVIVARPSKWGNPFKIDSFKQVRGGRREWSVNVVGGVRSFIQSEHHARKIAADEFGQWLSLPNPVDPRSMHWRLIDRRFVILNHLKDLQGHDLACWCPLAAMSCGRAARACERWCLMMPRILTLCALVCATGSLIHGHGFDGLAALFVTLMILAGLGYARQQQRKAVKK